MVSILLLGFNSTLVQLKAGGSEHLQKKINCFNSTLVQLKGYQN